MIADWVPTRFCSTTLQLAVDQAERLLQRLDQFLDRLVAPDHLDPRRLLELAERGPGELEERLVVPAQRVGRQRREGIAHAGFRFGEDGQLLGRPATFGGDLGLEPRAVLPRRAERVLKLPDLIGPRSELGRQFRLPVRRLFGVRARNGQVRLELGRAERPLAVQASLHDEPARDSEHGGQNEERKAGEGGHLDEV